MQGDESYGVPREERAMQQFKNILVGVDLSSGDRIAARELSDSTREAIRQALWLGEHLGAQVTYSTALDIGAHTEELIAADVEHLVHSVDDQAFEILREIHQQAKDVGVDNRIHIVHGQAWETIVRKVIRDKHDLVIAGTRERTLLNRMLFGTTGVKLLRYCPCPVWLTKPGFHEKDGINVLVADDLRDVGAECLRLAISGGQIFQTHTHVMHIIENPVSGETAEETARLQQEQIEAARQALEMRLSAADYRTLERGVRTHVAVGRPDEELLKVIKSEEIDVLIMGTAGGGGLSGYFFGTTVERILPKIDCSLIAVKPADFRSPIKLA